MNVDLSVAAAFVLTVLANGLWQAAVLALAAWIVLRNARSANATTRHAVLVTALCAAVALPVATTAAAFLHQPVPAVAENAVGVTRATRAAPSVHVPPKAAARTWPVASASAPAPVERQSLLSMPRLRFTLPRAAILGFVALWLAGALVLGVRLIVSLLYLERLKRDALPLPVEYRERLERWAAVGKGARDVRLCRSGEVAVPIAVGIFDAMILLPERLIDDLPAEDLDRILLHELAHLRRGDDWVNAMERVAEALLFFNPGVRWIVRQLDIEREVACDDWVLERRSEALPYAQCLVKLVENVAWPYRPMTAPGVFVTRRSISVRIERLLAKQRDVRLRIAAGPLAAVAGIAAAACLLAAYVSPSFASATSGATARQQPSLAQPNPVWHRSEVAHANKPVSAQPQWARKPAVVGALQPTPSPTTLPTSSPTMAPTPEPSAAPTAEPRAATTPVHAKPRVTAFYKITTRAEQSARTRVAFDNGAGASGGAREGDAAATADAESAGASRAMSGGDYIAEMASVGYANLSVDELIRLKSLGVTAAYVREMQAAGFGHPSADELARMRAIGLTPAYVGDMRRIFPSVSLDDLISMRAVGVTPAYVAELRSAGVTHIGAEEARSMRAVGVDPAYVRSLAAAGFSHRSADELTRARAVGVDDAFLNAVKAHGLHNLSLDDLIRLKTSGVLLQ